VVNSEAEEKYYFFEKKQPVAATSYSARDCDKGLHPEDTKNNAY